MMHVLLRRASLGCLTALCATAALAATVPAPAAHGERWGLYATLAENDWISRIDTGHSALIRYRWTEPGRAMRAEHRVSGTPGATIETITLGAQPNELTVTTTAPGQAEPSVSTVRLNADGSAVETYVGRGGSRQRATYTPDGADRYKAVAETETPGGWRRMWSSEVTRLAPTPPAQPR